MAKPNYSFEKRQRELAKKKKKEEKLRDKADRKTGPEGSELPADDAATPRVVGVSEGSTPAP